MYIYNLHFKEFFFRQMDGEPGLHSQPRSKENSPATHGLYFKTQQRFFEEKPAISPEKNYFVGFKKFLK